MLEMSNDGHAYIGILKLSDGTCVNVSLPDRQSRRLMNLPAREMTVAGRVWPFVYEDALIEVRVNGRQIGYGNCGRSYVFVD
jgi:hypothetical protein